MTVYKIPYCEVKILLAYVLWALSRMIHIYRRGRGNQEHSRVDEQLGCILYHANHTV